MMKAVFTPYFMTASAVLTLSAGAAWADLTAEQVWEDWRSYYEAAGYEFNATIERSGDILQVSDLELVFTAPDESAVTLQAPSMSFVENGDGTVSVRLPESFPVLVDLDAPGDEDVLASVTVRTQDLDILVSGDLGQTIYDYTAAGIEMVIDELSADGETIRISQLGTAEFRIADIEGQSVRSGEGDRQIEQNMTVGQSSYKLEVDIPNEDEQVFARGGFEAAAFQSTTSIPENLSSEDPYQLFDDGFAVEGVFNLIQPFGQFDGKAEGKTAEGRYLAESGSLSLSMDKNGISYSSLINDFDMALAGDDFPVPIDASMKEAAFGIQMPISASDAPQDFALNFKLDGFAVSETIWGLFDPAGQLPRDPATIALDLNGTGTLDVDLMDQAQLDGLAESAQAPGELLSLTLNELVISAAGAALFGEGGLTFDNTDLTTFEGFPAPQGALDLKIDGADRLLNTLTGMGLLPAQQASIARLVMGLYTVPGPDPDSLTSRIEARPDGQVLANGQRIR